MSTIAYLSNACGALYGAPQDVLADIHEACSFEIQGAEFSELYQKGWWDGKKHLFDKRQNRFPLGLWPRIREVLDLHGVTYTVYDNRTPPRKTLNIRLTDRVEIRDYQQEAVRAAIREGRTVIQAATGAGKTVIAAMLIAELRCPTLFFVHTRDLLYQAKQAFEQFLEGVAIGQIGDGVVNIQPVTVATMQAVARHLGITYQKSKFDDSDYNDDTDVNPHRQEIQRALDEAGLLIWDEVHRIACETAYAISERIRNAYYRIGLSASPWRDDNADLMIEAAMGQIGYRIAATELIQRGYLVPPIIRMVRVPSSVPWWDDTRSYRQVYRDEIVENEARNRLIMKYAIQFVEMGIPTLILVQQINHGKKLQRMISEEYHPIDFISGSSFSRQRTEAIQRMRDGEIPWLIASTIADEGLDIKRLGGLILAGGGQSSTRALQRIGRVMRPFSGKTHALVVDFYDQARYLRDHARKRMQIYRSEPGFTLLEL